MTDALGAQVPTVTAAMEEAFMTGLGASCLLIGLLGVAGAVFCLAALPGNGFVSPGERSVPRERPTGVPG